MQLIKVNNASSFQEMDLSDPNSGGATRHHIVQSVENSLERLKTSYIDLLYVHVYDYGTCIEETLRAMTDVVKSGKVNYTGASNFTGWQVSTFSQTIIKHVLNASYFKLQKALDTSKYLKLEKFCCVQMQYNLICRDVEFDTSEVCKFENISLLPWSPLKGGYLSGKIDRNSSGAPEGSRIHATINPVQSHPTFEQFNNERTWAIIDTCREIGSRHGGKTVPQVALRWLMQKSVVPSVVFGAKTVEQLEENLGAVEFQLSEEEMMMLDEVSKQNPPVVQEQIYRMNNLRFLKALT